MATIVAPGGHIDAPLLAAIFPDEAAFTRYVLAILLEQNDEWAVQRCRYMTVNSFAILGDDAFISPPEVAV